MKHKLLEQKYTLLGFILSLIFMYLAFRKVDIRALGIRLKTVDLTYMLLAFLPQSASYITRTFLWRRIISTFKNVDFSNAFSALMIGYFGNNVLPGRAGEFMRAYILGSKEKIGKAVILGTIVIERLSDILTLLLFLVLSTLIFPMPQWAKHIVVTTSIILLIILAVGHLILLKQNPLLEKLDSKPFFLSNPKRRFVITRLDSFASALGILKEPKLIFRIFILSLLTWLLASVAMFLTFESLHINVPGYAILFVLSITNLGLIIPSSPGYIGTYQFLCVIALSAFSINKETALSFSIIYQALWYLPSTILGLVFLWRENLSLARLKRVRETAQG